MHAHAHAKEGGKGEEVSPSDPGEVTDVRERTQGTEDTEGGGAEVKSKRGKWEVGNGKVKGGRGKGEGGRGVCGELTMKERSQASSA